MRVDKNLLGLCYLGDLAALQIWGKVGGRTYFFSDKDRHLKPANVYFDYWLDTSSRCKNPSLKP